MHRRHALQIAGTAAVTGLAGCTGLATTRLTDAQTEHDDRETHATYRAGGQRLVTFSASRIGVPAPERGFPLRLSVWHSDDTHLDSLRVTLHAPWGDPGEPQADVLLARPGGHPVPPITFSRTDDGDATVIDVPDVGFQGTGTFTLDTAVVPFGDWQKMDVRVAYSFTLSKGGLDPRTYVAEDALEFSVSR